ncbi:MAG: tripartite tricarboxylate transporter family receptor [Hyphomicrobiales bacterium]|nr:tripartite tricarboxylate transporter family receptor [Hyphomicrobiales bacterium]
MTMAPAKTSSSMLTDPSTFPDAKRSGIQSRALTAVAALTALAIATPGAADSVSDFYAGKSLNLIISTGVGGGLDANARLVARHLGAHVPGKPSVVPRNMTGAGHLQATNFMYNQAPRDGTHIGAILPSFALYQIIDGKGAQYDSRRFNWLGASDVDNMNLYVWSTAGVKTVEDAKRKEVLMGATGAGSYTVLFPTLMNNLLGTKFKNVAGYKSTNEIHLAMERGEVQGRAGNFFSSLKSGNADWLRDGKIDILVQIGAERDPDFPNVPLLHELAPNEEAARILRLFSGEIAMGRSYLTTPDVPADRLAALQAAFAATMRDPAFLDEARKASIDVRPLGPERLKAILDDIMSTPPDLLEKAKDARGR